MSFYVFNLKNAPDFQHQAARPLVEELGPFVYREQIIKDNVLDNRNYTITYTERKTYEFVPEMSALDESTNVTSLNMAVVTIMNRVKYMTPAVHDLVNVALKATRDNSLLVTKSVREILFGYEDEFLKELKRFAPQLVNTEISGLFVGVYIENLLSINMGCFNQI